MERNAVIIIKYVLLQLYCFEERHRDYFVLTLRRSLVREYVVLHLVIILLIVIVYAIFCCLTHSGEENTNTAVPVFLCVCTTPVIPKICCDSSGERERHYR